MPGVPWHTQILAAQLTLFQPGGTDYAHLITIGTPGISNLPTALQLQIHKTLKYLCITNRFHYDFEAATRSCLGEILEIQTDDLSSSHKSKFDVQI